MKMKPEYFVIHQWVYGKLGKADHCSLNNEHISTRYHWANISGEYKWDVDDWMQMCSSCHQTYDFTELKREELRAINIGNKNSKRVIVKQFEKNGKLINTFDGLHEASRYTNVSVTTIHNAKTGRSRTAGGYIYGFK